MLFVNDRMIGQHNIPFWQAQRELASLGIYPEKGGQS